MTGLAKTLFAEERQVVRLLNIEYKPPVVPTAAGAQPTTPTLMSQPTTSTLGMVPGAAPTTGTVALQPAETEAVVEVYPTATPAPTETPVPPTPTLSPLVATPSPAAAPMQSFRLRNGLTFKGRIILDVENQVTIVTEDGTQLKIPKSQIVSPSLESKP